MRDFIQITEGRDAPLFHSTNPDAAEAIISNNIIEARTIHGDIRSKGAIVSGVSLTRSMNFARSWDEGGIIFQLDQRKLAHNYEIFPYHYYQTSPSQRSIGNTESEEFVVGPIRRLKRYLVKIHIFEEMYNALLTYRRIEKEPDAYSIILDHPLLVKDISKVRPDSYEVDIHKSID